MTFKELFSLFYNFSKEDELTILERPTNIIGSFCFTLFFYTLFYIEALFLK